MIYIIGANQQVLDEITSEKSEGIIIATTSVPCFEYWLLLHFGRQAEKMPVVD